MDTNVLSNIRFINFFMPLILEGQVKTVTMIFSAMTDTELVNKYELTISPIYAMFKAALNMVAATFNAEYKKDEVLFLSICSGMVYVAHYPLEELSLANVQAVTVC
jgi:NAD(P)-dependent dehydrogenase (short-subunit alcohol dehydrogenase family)